MPGLAEVVPKEIRARLAFELLASSTISRYVRVARSFGANSKVREAIDAHGISIQDLLRIAEDSWRFTAGQSMRDEQEVDLVLALSILSNSADSKVDEFLQQVGLVDRPSLSWVSALARYLNYHRPASYTIGRLLGHRQIRWLWAKPDERSFSFVYSGELVHMELNQDSPSVNAQLTSVP